jgi:hypothetical protein
MKNAFTLVQGWIEQVIYAGFLADLLRLASTSSEAV